MQIGFLDLYSGVLNVRQERSSLIADNIANADTPGYKATDVSFQQALAAQLGDTSRQQRADVPHRRHGRPRRQ